MTEPNGQRVAALDWMRGFVMVLMTVDHASLFFNAGRVADDSAASYAAGSALPMGQFLLRWVTHLCAPTFVFLAGASLAHSAARRAARDDASGVADRVFGRDMRLRGAVIVLLDLTYMSMLAQHLILQVLYAIGLSMVCMSWLRRLPDRVLLALGLGWFVVGEALTGLVWHPPANASTLAALTLARAVSAEALIFYPVLPWLAMMVLGWVFGRHLLARGSQVAARTLALAGGLALGGFVLVRGLGGYGNMWLQRGDGSLQQWLHVSKYPPSLSYATLELGLMALCLALLLQLAPRVRVTSRGPFTVFGQTALFFYLMHFGLLGACRHGLGIEKAGIGLALVMACGALALLYPCCLWYRARKRARPQGWLRFI